MKRFTILLLLLIFTILLLLLATKARKQTRASTTTLQQDTIREVPIDTQQILLTSGYDASQHIIETGDVPVASFLTYAKTLQGIPYKYGSIDPEVGFDCSGFITYTFNHFGIAVPRSSVDFTNVQTEVPLSEAKPGDLVLFTGTDSSIRVVGHMGIIVSSDNGQYEFIHSTSGKAFGVTITPLNQYYMGRFVKILRIFREND